MGSKEYNLPENSWMHSHSEMQVKPKVINSMQGGLSKLTTKNL